MRVTDECSWDAPGLWGGKAGLDLTLLLFHSNEELRSVEDLGKE